MSYISSNSRYNKYDYLLNQEIIITFVKNKRNK